MQLLELLSVPEMLGNWMDSRISCCHSAPTSFLLYWCSNSSW